MTKILGVCGSVRKGATETVILRGLEAAGRKEGIQTEFMTLRGRQIAPCNGCNYCREHKCGCVIKDDMGELMDVFVAADAYLIGTPVYAHTVTPQILAFFTRMRPFFHLYPETFRTRIGAALAVGGTRNGGEEAAVLTLIQLMMTRGINIISNETGGYIGGKVWSRDKKDFTAADDEIGMATVERLAGKLADMALIMKKGMEALKQPEGETAHERNS
jgi:multimeric flavodoxin WrbA